VARKKSVRRGGEAVPVLKGALIPPEAISFTGPSERRTGGRSH
jgi:hypothetical protein